MYFLLLFIKFHYIRRTCNLIYNNRKHNYSKCSGAAIKKRDLHLSNHFQKCSAQTRGKKHPNEIYHQPDCEQKGVFNLVTLTKSCVETLTEDKDRTQYIIYLIINSNVCNFLFLGLRPTFREPKLNLNTFTSRVCHSPVTFRCCSTRNLQLYLT